MRAYLSISHDRSRSGQFALPRPWKQTSRIAGLKLKGVNMAINRVTLAGNLTRDPELRTTSSGAAVLGMGLAVNDRKKNIATGEWEDSPLFIDCAMFGPRAGKLSGCLRKGAKVSIAGRLKQTEWERDGQKRSKIEVLVEELEFMSPRQAGTEEDVAF